MGLQAKYGVLYCYYVWVGLVLEGRMRFKGFLKPISQACWGKEKYMVEREVPLQLIARAGMSLSHN